MNTYEQYLERLGISKEENEIGSIKITLEFERPLRNGKRVVELETSHLFVKESDPNFDVALNSVQDAVFNEFAERCFFSEEAQSYVAHVLRNEHGADYDRAKPTTSATAASLRAVASAVASLFR